MIVDDHPMWCASLREVLEHAGVGRVVSEVTDGQQAIDKADESQPDLVIMDINLPGMDGIETTKAMRDARPDVKVLVLSSSDEHAHVIGAIRAGASGYMVKTASPEEVAEAARRVSRGELVFPPVLSDVVLAEFRRPSVEGPAPPPVRVVVADGAVLAREGLVRVLDEIGVTVVGQAGNPDEVLAVLNDEPADVVVLDARIACARPDGGASILGLIRAQHPNIGLLVLSSGTGGADMIATGSVGYLLKDRVSDLEELDDAIRRVARGETVIDPQVASGLVERPPTTGPLAKLTARERDVLALMAEGRTNKGIGDRLFLGQKAVEAHVRDIFTKLGLTPTDDDHRRVLAVVAYLRSTR
jgi:serine/threonine-protein kinase